MALSFMLEEEGCDPSWNSEEKDESEYSGYFVEDLPDEYLNSTNGLYCDGSITMDSCDEEVSETAEETMMFPVDTSSPTADDDAVKLKGTRKQFRRAESAGSFFHLANADARSRKEFTSVSSLDRNSSTSQRFNNIIMKPSLKSWDEDIPICTKRSSWKALRAPDLNKVEETIAKQNIKRVESMASFFHKHEETNTQPATKSGSRGVSFQDITIREYDLTLGDNPSVSFGPALSLDWDYYEGQPICIEAYETNRLTRANSRLSRLTAYERKQLLLNTYGHTRKELDKASKEIQKVQRQRLVTEAMTPFYKVECALESASRKIKRAIVGKKTR